MKIARRSTLLVVLSLLAAACSSPTAPAPANPCAVGAARSTVALHCVTPVLGEAR